MIHVLNNLPKDYDVILNGLNNCLTATGDDVFTINVIPKKMNHQYEKIKNKKRKKSKNKKSFGHIQ